MEQYATTQCIAALLVLLLGSVGGVWTGYAQPLTPDERLRLSPRLRSVATGSPSPQQLAPLLPTLDQNGRESRRYGVFIHTSDPEALRDTRVSVHPLSEGLVTARVTGATLRTIAQTEGVRYVESARTYTPLNDVVRSVTGAHSLQTGTLGRRYTGKNVLACVIDSGIDWRHPDFRGVDDSTQSRIRALWDQTLSPEASEQSPSQFNYGVEYTRSAIENELDGTPAGNVRSTDPQGHGTHVAATMAGNGEASPSRTHRGMAPDAGIVAVKTDFSGVGITDGLRYCRSVAEAAGRPVVVSLSLGTAIGPHDGTSPLARVVDAFSGPGRSVVAAAGNSGDVRQHRALSLSGGTRDSLTIRVPEYSPREGSGNDVAFRFDAWLAGGEGRPTAVVTPSGQRVPLTADTAAAVQTVDGTVVYELESPPQDDRHLEVLAYDASAEAPPTVGAWTLVLTNDSSQTTTLDGWLAETTTDSHLPNGDHSTTLAIPATAHSALTVGAWTQRNRWQTDAGTNALVERARTGTVAPFSSRGPLRGGGQKPDLLAPGQWTVSARSRSASLPARQSLSNNDYALFRGTSTAAAAAAGAVALLLQENPSLSPDQIASLLTKTAQPRAEGSRSWTAQAGYGRLDVFRAMADLRGTSVATRTAQPAASPSSNGTATAQTLGGAGAEALAARFTPSRSGSVDGLFVKTAAGSANRLRDSLVVSLWTDANGTPDRRIGTPVRVAPEALANHTTNFVSLASSGAVVSAQKEYHVVLTVEDGGGELDVRGEQTARQARASLRSADGWRALSTTLGLQVTTSFALDLGAPRPSAPSPATIIEASESPTLSWESVPDADSYTVQLAPSPQFSPSNTDTLQISSPSLTLSDLAPSRAYYWRVRAERLEYSGPWSDSRSFLYYPVRVKVEAARSFEAEGTSPTYRLVALPGQQTQPLAQTLRGRGGTDWNAYWDRGRSAESLVSFDGSSTFRFRPGTGFWLRSERPWQVGGTVPSVPLQEDGTYTIELHDGWNIISNPFDLDLSWGAVEAANGGSLSPLWRFSGQFEQTSTLTSAQEGEAFYFLNDQDLKALRLPYPAFPNAPSGTPAAKSAPSPLTLTAFRSGSQTSQIRVGAHENAENGRDLYDQVAPPSRFAPTSLRLTTSGEGRPPRQRQLIAEYRSTETEGHTFSLTLQAEPGAPVELRADGLDAFKDQEVVLVDPSAGQSYDLRTTSTVTLRPEEGARSLRLLVGSSDYVETKKQVALPSDLRFLPNYPNPFDEQTTLEYVLPEPASVRLAVYDVLGRQVRVLVNEKQKAGRHTVQWNGRDESGRRMASGMYLARLVVDGTTKVRKMTFVR